MKRTQENIKTAFKSSLQLQLNSQHVRCNQRLTKYSQCNSSHTYESFCNFTNIYRAYGRKNGISHKTFHCKKSADKHRQWGQLCGQL